MVTESHISIIILNVHGLNAPTERHRLAAWIQKQDLYSCSLQETHLRPSDTYRLKVRGWKKVFHANRNQKKARVVILISDKMDFKTKTSIRDKEVGYIMITGSTQEDDITIISIYAPNIGASQHVRQIQTTIKGEIDYNSIIVGDFNTLLSSMDRSSGQKSTSADIYRAFHLKAEDDTFFLSARGTFSRVDHMLGHKVSLGKIKKIEVISSIFFRSHCYEIRHELQERRL